jgi:hypothetical protein
MSICTVTRISAVAAASLVAPASSAWAGLLGGVAGGSGIDVEWIFALVVLILLLLFILFLLARDQGARYDRTLSESLTISDRDNRSSHVEDLSDSFDLSYARRTEVILMVVVAFAGIGAFFHKYLGDLTAILVIAGVLIGVWLVAALFSALGEAMGSTWPRVTDNVAKDEASRDHYRRDRH